MIGGAGIGRRLFFAEFILEISQAYAYTGRMKTKLLRLAVIGLTLAALGRLGVTSTKAADSSSSSSSSGTGMGGCCGQQAEEEKPKNCPQGSTWNQERQTCLEPNGTPRAPLN